MCFVLKSRKDTIYIYCDYSIVTYFYPIIFVFPFFLSSFGLVEVFGLFLISHFIIPYANLEVLYFISILLNGYSLNFYRYISLTENSFVQNSTFIMLLNY